MQINEDKVYRDCVDKWGKDSQLDMMIEEAAELITAINHKRRGRITTTELINELVDVEIMIGQMKIMINRPDEFKKAKVDKLSRLIDRLLRDK